MALVQSSNNPFRDTSSASQASSPFQTPANTGSSNHTRGALNTSASSSSFAANSTGALKTNTGASSSSNNAASGSSFADNSTEALQSSNTGASSSSTSIASNAREPLNPPIPVEAPPAYTPSPNVYQGEASLEHGPARPFQQPPQQRQQWTGASNSSWSSYPGQQQQRQGPGPSHQPGPPPLPPRHSRASSDFAQDFYAVGGDVDIPVDHYSSSANGETSLSYAPQPPPKSPGGIPDNGQPTTKPVPGHPLLNNGRLLVYPKGFTCEKCQNTGYKQNDPSHPCRKCWQKYGKPFTGALTYASFSSDAGESSSMGTKTLQKPLPKLRPPQQSQFHPPPVPPPPPPPPPPQQNWASQQGNMPGSWPNNNNGSFGNFGNFGGRSPGPRVQQISPWAPLPQNGPVYRPGDPRIGGRLCWRCDGEGLISFFIFETDTCPTCGGIGRLL